MQSRAGSIHWDSDTRGDAGTFGTRRRSKDRGKDALRLIRLPQWCRGDGDALKYPEDRPGTKEYLNKKVAQNARQVGGMTWLAESYVANTIWQ